MYLVILEVLVFARDEIEVSLARGPLTFSDVPTPLASLKRHPIRPVSVGPSGVPPVSLRCQSDVPSCVWCPSGVRSVSVRRPFGICPAGVSVCPVLQCPVSGVRCCPVSNFQFPVSTVQCLMSDVRCLTDVQQMSGVHHMSCVHTMSGVQCPVSDVQ